MDAETWTKIADALHQNLWLLVGLFLLAYGVYRLVKWILAGIQEAREFISSVVDEHIPKVLKQTLTNGGGEIVRAIVREENQKQTEHHRAQVREAINEHAAQETARFAELFDDFCARMNHRRRRRR